MFFDLTSGYNVSEGSILRSMQIIEWGQPLQLRKYETPRPSGDQILLAIEACGVCHSDLHIHQGFFDLGGGKSFPMSSRGVVPPFTLGHEPVGKVVSVGSKDHEYLIGKSFLVYPWINCEVCQPCKSGMSQVCDAPKIIGTRVNGGYSDHVIIPDKKFLIDFTGINPHLACTLSCSGLTVYSALKKINLGVLTEKDRLVIIGAGGLGLAAISIAKFLTKAKLIVVDIDNAKLKVAQEIGADFIVSSAIDNPQDKIFDFVSSDTGVAACLDFVGITQTMALGLSVLRKGGTHIHVGLHGGAHEISLPPLSFRMLKIIGSYVGTLEECKELVEMVKSGLDIKIPIRTLPLEKANQAIEDLRNGDVVGRTVLIP